MFERDIEPYVRESHQYTETYCNLNDEECGGGSYYPSCKGCPTKIQYIKDMIDRCIEELEIKERETQFRGITGKANGRNTLALFRYDSDFETFIRNILKDDFEGYTKYDHGYQIISPMLFEEWYSFRTIYNYPVPDYYYYKKDWPLFAVYDGFCILVAPVCINDDDYANLDITTAPVNVITELIETGLCDEFLVYTEGC